MSRVRSPKYPNFSLQDAVKHAGVIYEADRNYPVTREDVAKHMTYTSLSGASDKAIATMMQYGMLERITKGEVRVSQNAIDILYPDNAEQRKVALLEAAYSPPLFRAIKERFPDREPSEQTLRSWLLREGFNDRAISPVIRAYSQTCSYLRQENASESGVPDPADQPKSKLPEGFEAEAAENETRYGGAQVGDLIQWESQGVLQLDVPRRVRLISEDEKWVAVEGSETGIPMDEVIVEERAAARPTPPPKFVLSEPDHPPKEVGEQEWMRNRLGAETNVRLLVKGEMGPKEIAKLITLLNAQKSVLEED